MEYICARQCILCTKTMSMYLDMLVLEVYTCHAVACLTIKTHASCKTLAKFNSTLLVCELKSCIVPISTQFGEFFNIFTLPAAFVCLWHHSWVLDWKPRSFSMQIYSDRGLCASSTKQGFQHSKRTAQKGTYMVYKLS